MLFVMALDYQTMVFNMAPLQAGKTLHELGINAENPSGSDML